LVLESNPMTSIRPPQTKRNIAEKLQDLPSKDSGPFRGGNVAKDKCLAKEF
jgi:hypothetical protein